LGFSATGVAAGIGVSTVGIAASIGIAAGIGFSTTGITAAKDEASRQDKDNNAYADYTKKFFTHKTLLLQ
jgi:hypothetical protein